MTPAEALGRLKTGETYAKLIAHQRYDVGIYKPEGEDRQTPHLRDEIYIVVAGTGSFVSDGVTQRFGPGDMLFVAAGVEHRFVDFSDDFSTWVIFFGETPAR